VYSANNAGNGISSFSNDSHGVYSASNDGDGIYSTANDGFAGYFSGNLYGTVLSKGSGTFMIDHPLDPENKFMYHSFVESPDMMNIYNGNVELDTNGEAIVIMEEWFDVLNKDFRYQLTAIGAPGPNLHIAEELNGNKFKIAGGTQGMKVSWMLTGIRQDPHAEMHRVKVEEDKPTEYKGFYLNAEAYGLPFEKSIDFVKMKDDLEQEENEEKEPESPRNPASVPKK